MSTADVTPSTNGRPRAAWAGSWSHLRIGRRNTAYCRVTFDHPPSNRITAATVEELAELVGLIEQDHDLNVVVFDSANPACYLGHHDAGDNPAWPDILARLSRAPVVSIAAIRSRCQGAGSEFVLACDLRFAPWEDHYIDRVIPDDRLDEEVDEIASRLARFDHDAIARIKPCVAGVVDGLASV